jgi:hypothetical protein
VLVGVFYRSVEGDSLKQRLLRPFEVVSERERGQEHRSITWECECYFDFLARQEAVLCDG